MASAPTQFGIKLTNAMQDFSSIPPPGQLGMLGMVVVVTVVVGIVELVVEVTVVVVTVVVVTVTVGAIVVMVDVVNVTPLLLILFNPTLKALGPFKYVKPWFNFNEAV